LKKRQYPDHKNLQRKMIVLDMIEPAAGLFVVGLKEPPDDAPAVDTNQIEATETDQNEAPDDEYIYCRQCYRIITKPAEQISVGGAHRHTFANPHGLVYEIGCFKTADGCAYSGSASDEFTWFIGFSWKVAICRTCFTHLGWFFVSANSSFNGLILDHLIY
jgi:hypothetical protein